MPQRGYILIFFFWALLAIITPTLVFWSASAKPGFSSEGEDVSGQKMARRMMGYLEEKSPFLRRRGDEASPAPAPAPTQRRASDEAVEEKTGLVRPG